jgi:hypothetical protein
MLYSSTSNDIGKIIKAAYVEMERLNKGRSFKNKPLKTTAEMLRRIKEVNASSRTTAYQALEAIWPEAVSLPESDRLEKIVAIGIDLKNPVVLGQRRQEELAAYCRELAKITYGK